jgi:hypothetical protein
MKKITLPVIGALVAIGFWLFLGTNQPDFKSSFGFPLPPGSDLIAISYQRQGLVNWGCYACVSYQGDWNFDALANIAGYKKSNDYISFDPLPEISWWNSQKINQSQKHSYVIPGRTKYMQFIPDHKSRIIYLRTGKW